MTLSPKPKNDVIIKTINGIQFQFEFKYGRSMYQMYHNCYEIPTVEILRSYLSENEHKIFFDIGANLGYISAIALGFLGKTGEVHSFEPVPIYAQNIKKIQELNPEYHLCVNNFALGDTETKAPITLSNYLVGYNTLMPNLIDKEKVKEIIEVEVKRLDSYIQSRKIEKIDLIKIDTEGYEYKVIKGMEKFFNTSKDRPPMIIEFNPKAYEMQGISKKEFKEFMDSLGYGAFNLLNKKPIDLEAIMEMEDILFAKK